ncbi:hypothetical protein predicted by Glimmer/Critica [Sorangium cellulosum So ce56]|uniref:Secreted protein n=1 Tax=Sorangium cellulosum (strain So ce56) TaxID=448385 RepID=A9EWR2_SORC5|nr:hypothetical protein [Sorangium cellulosum]CAN94343.1 hypothetical protein predicted by Glimmer/Critica [Sorangium cellulosum So ce56]
MLKGFRFTMAAAVLLVGSEAMAWSTSPIHGTGAVGHTAQGYAWKDWGGGAWSKWHSVAYGDTAGDIVMVARQEAHSGSPSGWLPWVIETVDGSVNFLDGLSMTIGKEDGTEFIAYVDVDTYRLKVARRVGGNAGNCGVLSQWDCETVDSVDVVRTPSIEVRYDSGIQDYVVYVVYTTETSSGVRSLKFARKTGGNPWYKATIKANTNHIRLASDAIALDGTTPFVAFAETSVGVQVSQNALPFAIWTTTLIDANGGGYASMDARSGRREIAYTSNNDLKSASWSSSTATWTVSTVDTAVEGSYVSLVIDDALNPQIAYRKGSAPWLARLGTSGWSTMGTVTPHAAGFNPSLQLDTHAATDKAILVHCNSYHVVHATYE